MTKFVALAFLSTCLIAVPVLADDTPGGVASDVGAIQKDNQSLHKTNAELAKDRAAKAQDKANGNIGGQAVDSLSIGADKLKGSEKSSEKSTDKKILNNDVNDATSK